MGELSFLTWTVQREFDKNMAKFFKASFLHEEQPQFKSGFCSWKRFT